MLALAGADGEIISWEFYNGVATAEAQFYLPDKAGYILYVGDKAGNESRMYFNVDRHAPVVEYSAVNVSVNGDFYKAGVSGFVQDVISGLGTGPVMLTNPPQEGDLGVHPTGAVYPSSITFAYSNLSGGNNYMFLAADNADNLGANELWLTNLEETVNITETGPWYVETLNNGLPFPANMLTHKGLVHLAGVITGRYIGTAAVEVSYPQLSNPNCSISGNPEGMSVTLSGTGYIPDPQENFDADWADLCSV